MRPVELLVLLLGISTVLRADIGRSAATIFPADKLAMLQQEERNALTECEKSMHSLPQTGGGKSKSAELWKQFMAKEDCLFTSAINLAKVNPKSAIGFSCLEWVMTSPRIRYTSALEPALELVTRDYADDPKIGRVVAAAVYTWTGTSSSLVLNLLNAVIEKNPNRTAGGQAAFGLAGVAKDKFLRAQSAGSSESEHLKEQAEQAFETVIRDYGDCDNFYPSFFHAREKNLADAARAQLYELRHLQVGQPAPEIEGGDLDGVRFKLSDYRGKVVLLVFWASWCGPCMAAVPHETALVERFKGRPFVLIGVNGDNSQAAALKAKVPWRSFWNGKEGPAGPIAVAWNIFGWPTSYVLDSQGIIRQKDIGFPNQAFDNLLEQLVSAAEKR